MARLIKFLLVSIFNNLETQSVVTRRLDYLRVRVRVYLIESEILCRKTWIKQTAN